MTIQEANKHYLDKLGSIYEQGEAGAITDWVIESITGIKKTARLSQQHTILSAEQESRFLAYLERLLNFEPVQYVLNECWFCGFRFYVDKNVLIPRPETEELVEWIISNCKFPVDQLTILDIGSGSGCIPVALKRRLGKAEVWGCDTSEAALNVAKRNADSLGVNVQFVHLDFLQEKQRDELPTFDIIVSNPPYVLQKDKEQMHPNVLDYEPHIALFVPDNDPLVFYAAIAHFGIHHLNKNGAIYLEIHENLGAAVSTLFESSGYIVEIKKDMQGKERMVRAFKEF